MPKVLGTKIKKIREIHNLSQNRFGKKLGLSGKTISAYERGNISPPFKVLEKICSTYDTTISYFIDNETNTLNSKINELENVINELKKLVQPTENI